MSKKLNHKSLKSFEKSHGFNSQLKQKYFICSCLIFFWIDFISIQQQQHLTLSGHTSKGYTLNIQDKLKQTYSSIKKEGEKPVKTEQEEQK